MAEEKHAKQVVHFALVPIGAVVEGGDAGYRRDLVGVRLDPDPRVVADTEQVVDNLEPLVARGEVDGGDGAALGKLGRSVVWERSASGRKAARAGGHLTLEERKDRDGAGRADVDGQFVLPDGELLDVFGETAHDPGAVLVQVVGLGLVLVGGVDEGGGEGADGIAGCGARVRGVLGDGDVGAGGGRETPHEGLIAGYD